LINLIELNNNVKKTTYIGIEKIDRGDSVCILGGPWIQVTQLKWGFHYRVPWDDWHPFDITTIIITVTEYLSVRAWFNVRHLGPWSRECTGPT